MNTYRTPLLVGLFALGLLVLAGCSCNTGACPPARTVAVRPAETVQVASVPPRQGICWIAPANEQVVLPNPPTVTVNQYGQVVSSTPAGRLEPPPAPELAYGYRP